MTANSSANATGDLLFDSIILLTEAGIKLGLKEEAISTACVFYHKFCSAMTIRDYDKHLVVMATLSLTSKVHDPAIKLGDVVNTCHRCIHKDKSPLEVGDLYWQLKESVGKYELLLLRAIKFNVHVQLPHSYLLHYLLALSRWVNKKAWQSSCVTSLSWAFLQDSFYTTLCLQESPPVMATAILYLAVQCSKLVVPGSDKAKNQWWEVFSPETPETKLQEVAATIMQCTSTINKRTNKNT